MKKTFQLLLSIILILAWTNIHAQERGLSTGKAPFDKSKSNIVYGTFPNPSEIAFANDNNTNATFSFPVPEGTPWTSLGTFSAPVFAGSMCQGGDGNLYLLDVTPILYQFDTTTGAVTMIGNITGMGGDQPNGISYNTADGNYYMVSSTALYSLDIGTLTATLIGNFTPAITGLMIDLCFDASGTCYAYEVNITAGAANAYIINLSNAALTTLGYVGFTPNYGQGMSYDYQTSKIYLSAFNYDTFTGQLREMDPTTGNTTMLYDWGDQVAPFAIPYSLCGYDAASNPNPPNGTVDVSVNGTTLTWDNGAGATGVEVWFGPSGNVLQVYTGAPITSWPTGALQYFTNYSWKIVNIFDTCNTASQWSFRTEQNPNLVIDTVFTDPFTSGCGNWTITNDGGTCVWDCNHTATEYALNLTGASGTVLAADADYCGSGTSTMTTATITTPIDATVYTQVTLEWDQDWQIFQTGDNAYVDVSTDGGSTWNNVVQWLGTSASNVHESYDITSLVAGHSFQVRFVSVQPTWDWWWAVDNVTVIGEYIIPVEFTTFNATTNHGNVTLNWATATETNNRGFQVEKKSVKGNYQNIAFVEGHGTTTQPQQYSYVDKNETSGKYTYRLKQVDFDGSYKYSKEIEADVKIPAVYSLQQNYPNPFNPNTKIVFSLASDSKVTLKVFDVLGRQITELLNSNMTVGQHDVTFNAENLPSGVYFYRLEATGINGNNFVSVKKMILTK